jgi:hypothetical protein
MIAAHKYHCGPGESGFRHVHKLLF